MPDERASGTGYVRELARETTSRVNGMSKAHRVFEWFREIGDEIQADWERLHAEAKDDPQRAGHGGEATWAELLRNWLPPTTR
jgi:hypothetical protein